MNRIKINKPVSNIYNIIYRQIIYLKIKITQMLLISIVTLLIFLSPVYCFQIELQLTLKENGMVISTQV